MIKLKYNGQEVFINDELDKKETGIKIPNDYENKELEDTIQIPKIKENNVSDENE